MVSILRVIVGRSSMPLSLLVGHWRKFMVSKIIFWPRLVRINIRSRKHTSLGWSLIWGLDGLTSFGIGFQFQRLVLSIGWLLFRSLRQGTNWSLFEWLIMISALFVVFTLNLMLICSLSVSSVRDVCRKFADGQASNLNQLLTWNSRSSKKIQCNGIRSVLSIYIYCLPHLEIQKWCGSEWLCEITFLY